MSQVIASMFFIVVKKVSSYCLDVTKDFTLAGSKLILYFNIDNNKIVCYPSIWFGIGLKNNIVSDMYPTYWTRIDV